jgi:hypothetical protein
MDQMPEHEMKEVASKDEKIYVFEYKKNLDNQDSVRLEEFLLKMENGLKGEGGLEGVVNICKGWRSEISQEK